MATLTPNFNLSKPDSSDQFDAFRQTYNDNMDIIDLNMGGGGGHTIIDENGSTMPTETALQFTGNVSVSDDNVNGRTVVNILGGGGGGGSVNDVLVNGVSVVDGNGDAQITSYKEITQAEYDALPSSKESDGIAYFIKDATSTSFMRELWTNPSPTASFASQTVTLASDDYDLLLFIHRANSGSTAPCNSLVVPKGQNGNFCVSGTSASGVIANDRRITYTDDTHIAYADNYYCLSHNAASVSNQRNIPYKIYGIKYT